MLWPSFRKNKIYKIKIEALKLPSSLITVTTVFHRRPNLTPPFGSYNSIEKLSSFSFVLSENKQGQFAFLKLHLREHCRSVTIDDRNRNSFGYFAVFKFENAIFANVIAFGNRVNVACLERNGHLTVGAVLTLDRYLKRTYGLFDHVNGLRKFNLTRL